MTSSDFTLDLAFSLFQSEEKFPINLDNAWEWVGYSRKDHAKRFFMGCGFIEGVDFEIRRSGELRPQGGFSNREDISMTIDCFKMWGMMAGTKKGKEIRFYFLECEKKLKELQGKSNQSVRDFVREHARVYRPEFQKEFYDQLYRVTGIKRPKRGQNPYTALLVREYVYGMFGAEILEELDRVNPIIGYKTYEVARATKKDLTSVRQQIAGQKTAVSIFTKNGKIGKANKARKKIEKLQAKFARMTKPHSIRLPVREHCFHQFCSDLIGLPSLQSHLQTMVHIMRTLPSDDTERFQDAMNAAFQGQAIKGVSFLILDVPDWKALD